MHCHFLSLPNSRGQGHSYRCSVSSSTRLVQVQLRWCIWSIPVCDLASILIMTLFFIFFLHLLLRMRRAAFIRLQSRCFKSDPDARIPMQLSLSALESFPLHEAYKSLLFFLDLYLISLPPLPKERICKFQGCEYYQHCRSAQRQFHDSHV